MTLLSIIGIALFLDGTRRGLADNPIGGLIELLIGIAAAHELIGACA